ncbi:MAG: bifunctional 4-hydroxy-2-oxoglutarate aldolase/2-dehydro-3-deoxy-phosphogluconate aldolase, partial [Sphingomonas sp.]
AIKCRAAPFYPSKFAPTGGVPHANAPDWLAFDPVLCVGGSWVCTGTPEEVEAKARAAAALR